MLNDYRTIQSGKDWDFSKPVPACFNGVISDNLLEQFKITVRQQTSFKAHPPAGKDRQWTIEAWVNDLYIYADAYFDNADDLNEFTEYCVRDLAYMFLNIQLKARQIASDTPKQVDATVDSNTEHA